MTFSLNSDGFKQGAAIPSTYAHPGSNQSPPLSWSGAPAGTKSFILIVEDHDAPVGTFTHWTVYDIPAERTSFKAGEKIEHALQGTNDMGNAHYDGPEPPKGHGAHRYHFRLAALSVNSLSLAKGADSNTVKNSARKYFLAEAQLVGTYEIK